MQSSKQVPQFRGRPCKWAVAGKTKTIRVPVAFLVEILALLDMMEQRELAKSLITVGHPSFCDTKNATHCAFKKE